jgi:hypothetical protein
MRSHLVGALIGALLLVMPAQAEDKVPSPVLQEILIKTTLLTFSDANLTGNYTVLHTKLAKAFRDKITPDGLKQAFKTFADQKINLGLVAAMPPVASSEATIDNRGALVLRGYFATKPSRVSYELYFLPSEGEWKPALIDVRVKPPNEG